MSCPPKPADPIPPSRRAFVAWSGAALLSACAATLPAGTSERIVDVRSGRELTRAELLAALHAADFALLGELHDNRLHHARRGELLAALGPDVAVLAEYLTRGRAVRFTGDLRQSLVDAGFDPKGWQWPMHEPLFAAIARSGASLAGANAPAELIRRAAREGRPALPADLATVIDAAPLPATAQVALDADLVEGHCGHLGGARLEAMRWAQRARDATMWLALRDAQTTQHGAGRRAPVVLVAGNGHVRTDYGVPQLIAAWQPTARFVAVGFGEAGAESVGAPYTHLWITARAERGDPCAGLGARMAGL